MIGRKHRKRVVFVDGIPIEATILDAGASGLQGEERADPAALDPQALFDKYDADGSGGIDFDEFQVLLADLKIALSEPKARAYFRRCDVQRRGNISFEEFRLALYTCDPKNPGRTMGFAPGQSLSPKDLFEMFDREEQGAIDRATFIEVLEFLGKKLALADVEAIFAANEDPELEMMGYFQFKKVWLSLVDVRDELRRRHERFNRFLPNSILLKKLEALVNLEEKQEAKTLLEAANSLDDERLARERRSLVDEALLLSRVVLGEALDAAGQVYLFGRGPSNCFDGEPMQPDFADFMEFELVKELWKERVRPDAAAASASRIQDELVTDEANTPDTDESTPKANGATKRASESATSASKSPELPSRSRIAVTAAARAFAGRQVSLTTAFLWAKRVRSIACGSAVAYAVTDAGEMFCWGGKQRAWRYFYDQSTLDNNAVGYAVERPSSKNGGERPPLPKNPGRPLTTRSEMLKLSLPSQVATNQSRYEHAPLRRKYRKTFVKPERVLPTEDDERARLLLVGRYYDLELRETVEPELNVDDLALSLQIRGVYLAKQMRTELIVKLGDSLALEIECVGDKFHEHMKEQDKVARRLRHERREKAMLEVAAKTAVLWFELGRLQASIVAAESDAFAKDQHNYLDMKHKIVAAKLKVRRQAREGFVDQQQHELPRKGRSSSAPGDDIDKHPRELLHANGLTSRGSPLQDFDGHQAVECIAVGSRHALAVHQSGKLLTWGVGSFGRLGGARDASSPQQKSDRTDPATWHSDAHTPEVVDALGSHRFRAVACGFSHSLALTNRGQVFVWGSATHGKLGIGAIDAAESFTLLPMPLQLPAGVLVRKIACGPSHSAVLSVDGQLFVWGSGDGGKLGLGDGRDVGQDRVPRNGGKLGVLSTPTRVLEPFANEKLVDVSCGAGHTAVLSATVRPAGSSGDSNLVGGRVFVAGSSHALAKFTPTFAPLEIMNSANASVPMAKVSCGNAHTALVSTDGELFTWGSNVGGCTGHSVLLPRIATPTRVSCMYQTPTNLCLLEGVRAAQSTQNASCFPDYALRSPLGEFAQTQQEMCPFWQVTLLRSSRIESVRVAVWSAVGANDATARTPHTRRPMSSSGSRLKYAVLISPFPFDTEERGKYSLAVAKSHSTHVSFSLDSSVQSEWRWTLPVDTFGRFVRVQLDNVSGMLSLRAVEVVGMDSTAFKGPRVSDVACGEAVTAVICRPLSSTEMLREWFLRAVRADRASLWVLQQIESFHPFLQDELVVAGHRGRSCVLCRPRETCVVCLVEQSLLSDGKVDAAKLFAEKEPNSLDGGSNDTRGASAVAAALERNRDMEEKQREAMRRLTLEELCHQLLTMNMRTEEEEAAQQQKLEQDLLDMNALATGDKQQQQPSDHNALQGTGARTGGDRSSSLLTKLKRALGLKSAVANQIALTVD